MTLITKKGLIVFNLQPLIMTNTAHKKPSYVIQSNRDYTTN